MPDLSTSLLGFLAAMLIGALIGLERERHKSELAESGAPGVRSFAIAALSGATASWLQQNHPFPGLLLAICALVAAAGLLQFTAELYHQRESSSLTTQLALIMSVLLGALAMDSRHLAAALAICTMALLAYKRPLHEAIKSLHEDDVYAAARLLIVFFIILPLLPQHAIDPWGAINPYQLGWLVALLSGLSFTGYLAARHFGRTQGSLLTSLAAALVSSTAVTLSLARQSRRLAANEREHLLLAANAAAAWGVMFVRLPLVVALLDPHLGVWVGVREFPLALLCGLFAVVALRRSQQTTHGSNAPELRNPFSLLEALQYAFFLAALLLIAHLANTYLSPRALPFVAAIAGLTDVDPISVAMAQQALHATDPSPFAQAILVATISNSVVRFIIAIVIGQRRFFLPLLALLLAICLPLVACL